MDTEQFKEGDTGWRLPVAGWTIDRLHFDCETHLHLLEAPDGSGTAGWEIRLAGAFRISAADRLAEVDHAGPPESLAPALRCLRRTITDAFITTGSTLRVSLDDGTIITADPTRPDPNYEAWEVNGPGVKFVAMPGGGQPAIWDDTSPTFRMTFGEQN